MVRIVCVVRRVLLTTRFLKSIILAMARVRSVQRTCPVDIQQYLMHLLHMNDNRVNRCFSHFSFLCSQIG